jgi:hypothetical protein
MRFSPDGKWATYISDESGKEEVYVVPFPDAGGKWQVSNGGGEWAEWRKGGKEIIFGAGSRTFAVEVSAEAQNFTIGAPKLLGDQPSFTSGDVTADGERFLMAHRLAGTAQDSITLESDWTRALNK